MVLSQANAKRLCQPSVSGASFNEDEARPEVGCVQGSDESVDEVSE